MKWDTLLYSCFATKGGGYDFDVLPPGHDKVADALISAKLPTNTWTVGEAENKVFFGKRAFVGDHLGSEHPIAHDKSGRRLEFSLLYTAPKGTPLPSVDDLQRLDWQVGADLARLGNASLAARGIIHDAPQAELPDFSKSLNPTTAWDKTVAALNSGKSAPMVAIEADGTHRVIELAKAQASGTAHHVDSLTKNSFANKGKILEQASRLGFMKIAGISLAVAAVG